jgi:hypothetical protein
MTTNDIDRQLKLIEASQKIANIYTYYGQIQAAQKELSALGRILQANSRRAM